MKKVYKYKSGTIYVTLPESCDRNLLKKLTEDFLKKTMNGGLNNGDSNKTRNFRKK